MTYRPPLCAECDGFGDWLCPYHREKYDEALLVECLGELEAHLEDNLQTELLLDQWRPYA